MNLLKAARKPWGKKAWRNKLSQRQKESAIAMSFMYMILEKGDSELSPQCLEFKNLAMKALDDLDKE